MAGETQHSNNAEKNQNHIIKLSRQTRKEIQAQRNYFCIEENE